MQQFDIYFCGKLIDGADPAKARALLGEMFRLQGAALEQLFSGKPVRIKKAVDVDTANRFRGRFREAGALVDIVLHGQKPAGMSGEPTSAAASPRTAPQPAPSAAPPPGPPSPAAAPQDGFDLLPARSGSLEDCAPEVEARPIGDISWMGLDAVGVTLDERTPPPAAEIDTSALQMSEANSGTLADCAQEKPPQAIPDISHLKIDSPAGD